MKLGHGVIGARRSFRLPARSAREETAGEREAFPLDEDAQDHRGLLSCICKETHMMFVCVRVSKDLLAEQELHNYTTRV